MQSPSQYKKTPGYDNANWLNITFCVIKIPKVMSCRIDHLAPQLVATEKKNIFQYLLRGGYLIFRQFNIKLFKTNNICFF